VAGNAVSGSHAYAIFAVAVDDSRIQNNALDGNDHGIAVFDGGSRNRIQKNVVSHGSGSAIDVGGGAGNRIERNRLIDNGDGIIVGDVQDTLISRNLLADTGSSTPRKSRAASASWSTAATAPPWTGTSLPAGGVRPSS
jgi:parallel beta-helix repeat protein